MGEINSYRDLKVWQDAMTLMEGCYRFTGEFPREELYRLTNQIRRAAVSIPANIAEGYGRNSAGAYVNFLRVAQGSLKELETHLLLSQRLGFGATDKAGVLLSQCESVGRMLLSLARGVRKSEERRETSGAMDLSMIVARIERRLQQLNLTANAVSLAAGKPDAIRNLRRAVESGSREGISTATLVALADPLKVSVEWLATGIGANPAVSLFDLKDQ